MKSSNFSFCKYLFLVLFGIVSTSAIAIPSVLAEPGQIQLDTTQVDTTRIKPEILHDTAILRPEQKICGSRSPSECQEWLKKIRAVQDFRIIPQPQPDPLPQSIIVPSNPSRPR
ncbi:MAG: hypothetical protein RMY34_34290 [Aulosira sp. DedQUE10]|nr:hypothetical protein [Aulosira sp. DedQUE10]